MENGISAELAKLRNLRGADFVKQLKIISSRKEFHSLENDPDIFTVGGNNDPDYPNLLATARKAVDHGYKVYLLPNPLDFRTADYIFVRRDVYKLFDLKNISGKSIVGCRLMESIGQTNRVILNIQSDYSPSTLARAIKMYFEKSDDALEVLIFKGKKMMSVTRDITLSPNYYKIFMRRYLR